MKKKMEPLALGKIPPDVLGPLLQKYSVTDKSVIVGPGIGNDAAVIQTEGQLLVAKTDPITFVTDDIGYYVVNVNANDVACLGGTPKWFLVTVLLPENKTTLATVESIFSQLHRACRKLNIALCGGHTEITCGLDRPLIIGQMFGEVSPEDLVRPGGVEVGDNIILTKGIAIEATSIIAREKGAEIQDVFSADFVERCANFIYEPGISVVQDAAIARSVGSIHAMHDPTEGGLASGLHEIAMAGNVGLHINLNQIPVLTEAKLLCEQFGLDILGSIASGALLVAVAASVTPQLLAAYEQHGIHAAVIGKAVDAGAGVKLFRNNQPQELPYFSTDEIIRIFR